jgi:hypothetical protein
MINNAVVIISIPKQKSGKKVGGDSLLFFVGNVKSSEVSDAVAWSPTRAASFEYNSTVGPISVTEEGQHLRGEEM